ncbi:MAG TPA: hypothetical protein DDY16_08805 [Tenacibaculum sp.]|nr:hypothetical protein [Tenacibaculum sp.]
MQKNFTFFLGVVWEGDLWIHLPPTKRTLTIFLFLLNVSSWLTPYWNENLQIIKNMKKNSGFGVPTYNDIITFLTTFPK